MSVQIIVRRSSAGLHPVTAADAEILDSIPLGKEFTATLTQKRSQKQNRWYWTLLGNVVANHSFYRRSEPLHMFLKTRLGYVETIFFHDGSMQLQVTSTAFGKMDGFEMRKYMDLAIDVLCSEVIPGMDRRELIGEVENMLGDKFNVLFPYEEPT